MGNAKKHILIVDDSAIVRNLLRDFFTEKGWVVHMAVNGREAIRSTNQKNPDVILMDVMMPVMDGIKACQLIKNNTSSTKIFPVIIMTTSKDKKTVSAAIKAGCDDYLLKSSAMDIYLRKVEKVFASSQGKKKAVAGIDSELDDEPTVIIQARDVTKNLFDRLAENKPIDYPEVQKIVNKMIDILFLDETLPLAYKMRTYDDYVYIHAVNVASLCMVFAYHLKWGEEDLQVAGEGGFLHDVGKVKIDAGIMQKPTKLTDAEFVAMMKHPIYSKEILNEHKIDKRIQLIAIEHHERINGKGYPYQINSEQISKFGKLASIVDVYDALTTDRCYQNAIDSDAAILQMSTLEGHFDIDFFNIFTNLIKNGLIGK